MLLAITTSDEANILACLIAQTISKVRVKVARIRTHEVDHWKELVDQANLNIDLIIHPETDVADRIMRVMRTPGVSDIIEFFDGKAKVFGMNVDSDNPLAGKTLEQLDRMGPPSNTLIAMIFRGPQVIIPHGSETLKPGDHIYCVTTSDQLAAAMQFLGLLEDRFVELAFDVNDHLPHLASLAKRYANRKPDLADLCLIRMSELHPNHVLITVDREDFSLYRRNKREVIPIVCPPVP